MNLGGEISPAIGDLGNLQSMYVSVLLIPFVSSFIFWCDSIERFLIDFSVFINGRDLKGNKLTGQIPDEIGNCASLMHL